jgi:hypothetical protein
MRQPSIRSVKVRESPCASALLFCRSRGHETLIIRSCPSSVPSAKSAVHPLRLGGALPENCVFLAKSSEPSFRMTNQKFSMTDFQFRRRALVAVCRAVPWRLRSVANRLHELSKPVKVVKVICLLVSSSVPSVPSVVQLLSLRPCRSLFARAPFPCTAVDVPDRRIGLVALQPSAS